MLRSRSVKLVASQEHWFTIRRVYGDFWNFNSLFPAPQPLSQFYLSAFLATLREQGYTIFVVRGPLSQQQSEDAGQPGSHGSWFTPMQVSTALFLKLMLRCLGKPLQAVAYQILTGRFGVGCTGKSSQF